MRINRFTFQVFTGFVNHRNFAPGRDAKRRYCNEWLAYVDDLTVRTGRCVDGVLYSDSEVKGQLKEAVEAQGKMKIDWGGQPPEDALAALGFNVDKLGAEAYLKPAKQAPRQRALARPGSKSPRASASAVAPNSSSASAAGGSTPLRFSQPVHRIGASDSPKHSFST